MNVNKIFFLFISLFFFTLQIYANTLKVATMSDWAPFEYMDKNAKYQGITKDFLDLVSKKSGVKFEFVTGYNWNELLQMYKEGKIDLLPSAYYAKEREKFGLFTSSYLELQEYLYVKSENTSINSFEDLENKTLALPKGYSHIKDIKKNYPNINILELDTASDLIYAVFNNKADALLNSQIHIEHLAKEKMLLGLKGIYQDNIKAKTLHMLVQKNKIEEYKKIENIIKSISKKEVNTILSKYYISNNPKKNETIIKFTKKQNEYLSKKNSLSLCLDPNWYPIDKLENGKQIGISAEFIKKFKNHLPIPINIVPSKNWSETITLAQNGKCDIVSSMMETPSRKKYMNFTNPYISSPIVLTTKIGKPFSDNLEQIFKNNKIGVTKDFAFYELLKDLYPENNIVEIESMEKGLKLVNHGELYGFVDSMLTSTLKIQENYVSNLKVSSIINLKLQLRFGIKKDDIDLYNIFNKLVDTISEEEKKQVLNKWSATTIQEVQNNSLIYKFVMFFTILIILIILFLLREKNKRSKFEALAKELEIKNKELDKLLIIKSRQATFGTMIDTISHQWKQPLNELGLQILHLNSKILYDNQTPKKEELLEFTAKADNILEFMGKTVDTFRNFFKSSKDVSNVNLSEVLEDILIFFGETFKIVEIELNSNIQKNIYYPCLQEEFAHAILNILVNAKDIFELRKIENRKIEVVLMNKNNQIIIKIQDNAGGIRLAEERSIFNSDVSEKENGGLGLHITKKIIEEKMKGKIEAKNFEDGALFQISFQSDSNVTSSTIK